MLVNEKQSNVTVNLSSTPHRFRIDESSRTADLLMSKLYKSPITAILRELGTNAYEAHQVAGKEDIPFLVSLPTSSHPVLKIRDYGNGLSPSEVQDLYTVIGKSNKTNTNKLGGMFGLGSKTPVCYSDQFVVTSYNNGTKYTYAAYKDSGGYLTITLMDKKPTSESGLEIDIPVNVKDIYEFETTSINVYKFFKVIPTIKNSSFLIKPVQYYLYLNSFKILKDYYDPLVRMGNIVYPIPEKIVNEYGLVRCLLEANIGELEPNPSRESLLENDNNYNQLRIIINRYIEDGQKYIESLKYKNYYEAFSSRVFTTSIEPIKSNVFKFNNREITKNITFSGYTAFNVEEKRSDIITKLHRSNSVAFFLADKRTNLKTKVRKYCLTNRKECAIICNKKDDLKTFLDTFGIDESYLVKVSTINYNKSSANNKTTKIYTLRDAYNKKDMFVELKEHPKTGIYQNFNSDNFNKYMYLDLEKLFKQKIYFIKGDIPQGFTHVSKVQLSKEDLANLTKSYTYYYSNTKKVIRTLLSADKVKEPEQYSYYTYQFFGIKSDDSYFKKEKELIKNYPLLQYLDSTTPISLIQDYINDSVNHN